MMLRSNFIFLLSLLSFVSIYECGELSERKCQEYKELAYKKSFCPPLLTRDRKCTKELQCDRLSGLIVGGSVAKRHEFPHFALIGFKENGEISFKCGGSIISDRFILTASHCRNYNGIEASIVRVGEHALNTKNEYRKDFNISMFIPYKSYNSSSLLHDIALVKLTERIRFNINVRPACLHQNKSEILLKNNFVAIGFGSLGYGEESSNFLMKVNLTVIHPNNCKGLSITTSSQICVRGLQSSTGERNQFGDTCGGDSGGPIGRRHSDNYCTFDLMGITSYGLACGFGFGAVYTRIAFYLTWIENTVWSDNYRN